MSTGGTTGVPVTPVPSGGGIYAVSTNEISITRTVDPATAVITTAEAKAQARIDHSDEDSLIDAYVSAATKWCEEFCGRQFITATYALRMDDFPPYVPDNDEKFITLYYGPIQAVSTIKYIDTDGNEATWDSSTWQVDKYSSPARIAPAYLHTWPSNSRPSMGGVVVTYTAGYGNAATDVPDGIRVAVRMLTAHLYENREATTELVLNEVPLGIKAMLAPFWLPKIPRG